MKKITLFSSPSWKISSQFNEFECDHFFKEKFTRSNEEMEYWLSYYEHLSYQEQISMEQAITQKDFLCRNDDALKWQSFFAALPEDTQHILEKIFYKNISPSNNWKFSSRFEPSSPDVEKSLWEYYYDKMNIEQRLCLKLALLPSFFTTKKSDNWRSFLTKLPESTQGLLVNFLSLK